MRVRTEDVTAKLIADVSGPGPYVARYVAAKPARALTPPLAKFLDEWRRPSDKTIGYIANALAYGRNVARSPSYHTKLVRLIKGGHVRVCEVGAEPPPNSDARRDSPYGKRFYVMRAEACPAEIDLDTVTFSGARGQRRRRRK